MPPGMLLFFALFLAEAPKALRPVQAMNRAKEKARTIRKGSLEKVKHCPQRAHGHKHVHNGIGALNGTEVGFGRIHG
ncbi:hypothetical protein GCM10023186_18950 [Hymenobacter koreensis]|uniref:Secreted protein n=1 Tax=Hymenobacter koreensis TaxID=1084523 RepID=A0ABP8IZD4_9BACT